MNEQLLNIRFVQEVKKRQCLYNYHLMEYARKDVTEKAWREIGKIVNLTVSQCKEKWRNLRVVFARHVKPNKNGVCGNKRKPYYLTEAMQFTIPYIRTLNEKNLPDTYKEENIDPEDNEELDSPYLSHSVDHSLQPTSLSCPLYTSTSQNDDKNVLALTDFDRTVMDYFNAKKIKMEKEDDDVTESRKMFLLSLLYDVNSMSDIQMRTFKRKVLALIDEILEEPTHHSTQN